MTVIKIFQMKHNILYTKEHMTSRGVDEYEHTYTSRPPNISHFHPDADYATGHYDDDPCSISVRHTKCRFQSNFHLRRVVLA